MNVKIASLLAIVLVLVGGTILLLHILEKEQPPNEFNKISELVGNPENFDNKTVRIKGTINSVSTYFEIEDDTEVLTWPKVRSFEGALFHDREENLVIKGLIKKGDGWSPFIFHVENVAKAGTEPQENVVKINQILENWWTFYNKSVTIIGTMRVTSAFYEVSDNTGNITCTCSGKSFPYNVGENVIIEGKGLLLPSVQSSPPYWRGLWIEIRDMKKAE